MIRSIVLAGILVFALLTPTAVAPSFAHGHDDEGPAHGKSFKIQSFGMDKNGNPYLTVKGTAGEEAPDEEGVIFAYAFITDAGTYAVTLVYDYDGPVPPGFERGDS